MVGVLEGLAQAASRQSIGVNAMLDEVIAHGIGTALRQAGVVIVAARPVSLATDFDLLGLVTRIDDRKHLVQNAAAFLRQIRLIKRKVDAANSNRGRLSTVTIENFFNEQLPQSFISHQSFQFIDATA